MSIYAHERMRALEKENEQKTKVIGWLLGNDTGVSSKVIVAFMTGNISSLSERYKSAPSDPSDLGRCLRLLEIMPEWEAHLPELAKKYRPWTHIVNKWQVLKELYNKELSNEDGRALETYDLMLKLRGLR